MEIRHLRYFVAIAEAGSLMKASERLHVAQPALSVHVSNLEVELGVRLVERSNRGITLTEEGQLLYERALTMLQYHEEAIMTLKSRKTVAEGSVSIGVPSTLPGLIGPELYRSMKQELPSVSLYMVEASTAALYEWLQDGKIDFAILFSIPEDVGLDVTPLYSEDFSLVGLPDERGNEDIEFADLLQHELVMPCSATSWRKILDLAAEERGMRLTPRFETESMTALRSIAMSGEGVAVLPRSCVHEEVLAGRLSARRIVNPDLKGMKSIAHLKNKPMTAAHKQSRELICQVVRQVFDRLDHEVQALSSQGMSFISPSALFQRIKRPLRAI